jgi:hypothetical protein
MAIVTAVCALVNLVNDNVVKVQVRQGAQEATVLQAFHMEAMTALAHRVDLLEPDCGSDSSGEGFPPHVQHSRERKFRSAAAPSQGHPIPGSGGLEGRVGGDLLLMPATTIKRARCKPLGTIIKPL